MAGEKAVFEKADGYQAADDSGQAGGAAAVLQETFIDKFAEDRDLAEDVICHFSFSR
jgi:hypothetical protein